MSLQRSKHLSSPQRFVASGRVKRRLIRHHFVLFVLSLAAIAICYGVVRSDNTMFRLSIATAYTGLLLLSATLLVGPLNLVRNRPNPVYSSDMRRDIGIWGGIVSLVHVVVGLQVHLGSMLLYFVREVGSEKHLALRGDPFGMANYTGAAATFVIALLLALSNDWSLRRIGAKQWKSLQRWNYGAFALTVVHGVIYQVIEKRALPYPIIFALMVLTVIAVQLIGFRIRKLAASA
jgi:methionine sulfoxide reductase heme-binding subunit